MNLIILLPLFLVCGCMRVATSSQDAIAAQAIADSNAAVVYIYDVSEMSGVKMAADAVRKHNISIAKAMEIDPKDLPNARVTDRDWKADPNGAASSTNRNVENDSTSLGSIVSMTVIATMLAGIGLRIGAGALTATPFGPIVNMLTSLFGQDTQTKRNTFDKIIIAMEEYKDIDPAWETNKLYIMLSKRLTTAEKDTIKRSAHDLT